jgi:hypothetical protein
LQTVGVFYPADKQTLKTGAFRIQTGNGSETDQYIFKNLTISRQGKVYALFTFTALIKFKTIS